MNAISITQVRLQSASSQHADHDEKGDDTVRGIGFGLILGLGIWAVSVVSVVEMFRLI